MPETFILYRYFFKWLENKHEASTANWRKSWKICMNTLDEEEKEKLLKAIHQNNFSEPIQDQFTNPEAKKLIGFYTNYRNAVLKSDTELFKLKQEYDKNPTIPLKRKR